MRKSPSLSLTATSSITLPLPSTPVSRHSPGFFSSRDLPLVALRKAGARREAGHAHLASSPDGRMLTYLVGSSHPGTSKPSPWRLAAIAPYALTALVTSFLVNLMPG